MVSIPNLSCKIIPFIYTIQENDFLNYFVLERKSLTAEVKADPDVNRGSLVVNDLLFYKKILTYFANAC